MGEALGACPGAFHFVANATSGRDDARQELKRMRNVLIAAAFALAASPAVAQSLDAPAGAYVVDRTHASVMWSIKHQGLAWYNARFTDFDITLDFNPKDVTKSKVTATVRPASVETDYEKTRPAGNTTDFNAELANDARFFNVAKFPEAKFVSTSVTKTGENTGKMTGDLTFLGVTKPVTFDVTYIGDRNDPRAQKHKVGFQAVGSIKRSEFGQTFGVAMHGDEVRLQIDAEFVQK
jgi:polyisoprenoid-binding protein YceI